MTIYPDTPLSEDQLNTYYHLAPEVDVIPLRDGNLLFRSDTIALRIEGELAGALRDHILPLLDGTRTLSEVLNAIPHYAPSDVSAYLNQLANAHILRVQHSSKEGRSFEEQANDPFFAILATFGLPLEAIQVHLREKRVAIVGLEAHGGYVASLLCKCGVGSLLLIDPFPCEPGNIPLMPLGDQRIVGLPRQDVLQTLLIAQSGVTDVLTGGKEINRDTLSRLVRDCHMLVGCFDKGFSSSNHWLNRASLEHSIPAVYAESRAHTALVGPMVLPGQTACYMCYRMRSIACATNFTEAMEYEEFLDKRKRPLLHERAVLPTMPPYIASILTLEILKRLLSISESSLVGNVLEFNALTLESDRHSVLQKPDCPVCGPKKGVRHQPLLTELKHVSMPIGDLLLLAPKLVSHRTGVVRQLHRVQKDISEPLLPAIFQAEVANHLFVEDAKRGAHVCSGKGFTAATAKMSALGEAVERYSGACWDYEDIVYARRTELDIGSIDPRQFVLYTEEQYSHLPYVPYRDENLMGWVQARSLITDRLSYVPAIAVYMHYQMRAPTEYIFPVTSNGLAAGATLLNAVLSAALEVIERDAFMITWLHQLPAHRVTWENHPDQEVRQLCFMYRQCGVEMYLHHLPTDHPCHVFAAVAVQVNDVEPKVVVGMGADLQAHCAAHKAIIEVAQVRPGLRQRCRMPEYRQRIEELVADPHRVKDLGDHNLLYASPRAIKPLEFLFHQDPIEFRWDSETTQNAAEGLQRLVDDFASKGQDMLYYNLTPPDMRELGLHTVRVIIPGFQPIDFGWQERRLGGERLYELPQRLGFAANRVRWEQLNDAPHPMA